MTDNQQPGSDPNMPPPGGFPPPSGDLPPPPPPPPAPGWGTPAPAVQQPPQQPPQQPAPGWGTPAPAAQQPPQQPAPGWGAPPQQPGMPPGQPQWGGGGGYAAPPPKKKGKGCMIALIIVGVLVLVGGGGIAACSIWVFNTVREPIEVSNKYLGALADGNFDTAADLSCDENTSETEDLFDFNFPNGLDSFNINEANSDKTADVAVAGGTYVDNDGDEDTIVVILNETSDSYCVFLVNPGDDFDSYITSRFD